MQNYEAQGEIIKGKQQSVRTYVGNLQTNTDTLRSNFRGTQFPDKPVTGQHCFREDLQIEYIYNGDTWIENDERGTIAKEVMAARGSHDNLKARLDVALNDDGTLKAGAEINMNEWKDSLMTPSYIDGKRFSVPNNVVSTFSAHRALKIGTEITSVDNSTYESNYNRTIVTCKDAVVTSSITSVQLSIIQEAMPTDVVHKDDLSANTTEVYKHNHTGGKGTQIPTAGIAGGAITTDKLANGAVTGAKIASHTITVDKLDPKILSTKDLDVRSTGFKNHIASGFGVEINSSNGTPVVTQGRAFIENKYRDMFNDENVVTVKGKRGLLYADASTSDNNTAVVGFKEFIRPSALPQITSIPADDLRYLADFTVAANNPKATITDLSKKGCSLASTGAGAGDIKASNGVGWTVPATPVSKQNAYWYSGDKTWKGIKKGPWSFAFYFIPTGGGTQFPFSFYCATTYGWNMYVDLSDYNAKDETYNCGVYVNRFADFGAPNSGYMTRVYKNKPTLIVYEVDEEGDKIYINGVLCLHYRINRTFEAGQDGRICVNSYAYSPGSFIGSMIPLFACIRNGNWGSMAVAQMANQLGVPNEYVGFEGKLPNLYLGAQTTARYKTYHSWSFEETSGNTVYDSNKVAPMNGVTSNTQRVLSDARSGYAISMSAGHSGHVNFGNLALGDEFSFFILATIHADGTVASNHNGSSGFIIDVSSRQARVWVAGNGWDASSQYVPFGTPVVLGLTLKKSTGLCRVYVDRADISHAFTFTPNANYSVSAPFYIGRQSTAYGNLTCHAALSADRILDDSEIRAVFRSFKKRTYRNISDDMGLSTKAVIGMIQTDSEGKLVQAETTPRYGRRINPYKGRYFIGWYQTGASGELTVPNLYGSKNVAVNLYTQLDKNSPIIRANSGTTYTGGGNAATTATFDLQGVNCSSINLYVSPAAGGKNIKTNQYNRVNSDTPWVGIEVEPMADNGEIDSADY